MLACICLSHLIVDRSYALVMSEIADLATVSLSNYVNKIHSVPLITL